MTLIEVMMGKPQDTLRSYVSKKGYAVFAGLLLSHFFVKTRDNINVCKLIS